jgi:hypothetical protein
VTEPKNLIVPNQKLVNYGLILSSMLVPIEKYFVARPTSIMGLLVADRYA